MIYEQFYISIKINLNKANAMLYYGAEKYIQFEGVIDSHVKTLLSLDSSESADI